MRLSLKPSRSVAAVARIIVVASLTSCKDKEVEPAPAAAPSAARGQARVGCPSGRSDDPPKSEFRPALSALRDKRYSEAQTALRNLCEKYPYSATARVWYGDALLYDSSKAYVAAADEALVQYLKAHELRAQGCALKDVIHYYLRMGTAYAYLRKDQPERAAEQLEQAREEWPDSAEVFYHLARVHCQRRDFAACLQNLEQTFELARTRRRPLFLRVHRSLDDWFVRADSQSEFESLRQERASQFQVLKERYRSLARLP